MALSMSVNVSKCSGRDRRVNELGDYEQVCVVGSDPGLRGPTACSRSLGLHCRHFEWIEQPLGDLQITPASTDFDVRFGDTVEIAATSYQQVQPFGQVEVFRRLSCCVGTVVDFDAA